MTQKVLTKGKEYNMISKLYFDIKDLKSTIDAHNLRSIKRVHDSTDNQDTIGDLIDDLVEGIEELQDESVS